MPGIGRPKRISREVLEEAATELFLERGYSAVSVDDIATRAGVSRATFFNYFSAKVDVLFVEIDAALDRLEQLMGEGVPWDLAIRQIGEDADSRDVPLIARQADVMGAYDDVVLALPGRISRLRGLIARAVEEPSWQWALAGAIAHGAFVWSQDPSLSLVDAVSETIRRLLVPPEILTRFLG